MQLRHVLGFLTSAGLFLSLCLIFFGVIRHDFTVAMLAPVAPFMIFPGLLVYSPVFAIIYGGSTALVLTLLYRAMRRIERRRWLVISHCLLAAYWALAFWGNLILTSLASM